MSDQSTSTFSAAVDTVTAAAQSALGAITGNPADKAAAEQKQAQAEQKYEASHATAKVGSLTATADGTVTKDDPNRSEGSWNQTIGSGKAALGGLIGSADLKQAGEQQVQEGKQQEAQGQLNDLSSGIAARAKGAVGGAVAGLTGDRAAQAEYLAIHDQGKTMQRGVEADLQKQGEAIEKQGQ